MNVFIVSYRAQSQSLVGSISIFVVSALRVNALFPLLVSLVGCSPALTAARVSWDGPTPHCIVFLFSVILGTLQILLVA